jgi:L-alanine-DL-glutamate epimerase-like enolase superfamily enzyme
MTRRSKVTSAELIPVQQRAATIAGVRSTVVSVPLPRPVAWSNVRLSTREYVLVWIDTTDGGTGLGFTVGSRFEGGAKIIQSVITNALEPILIGRDPVEIEALWEEMSFQTLLLGRRGAAMRAISAVDIALWDLAGRSVGRPLCDLLGRYRSRVPAYASGGYYYHDDFDLDLGELEEEVVRHVELGFRSVKIKIGRIAPSRDRARVLRVLEAVGPDVRVALDANHAWRDAASAITDLRHLDELGLWWIEEPVLPDQMVASAKIAADLVTPIATGEIESTRWGFQQLVDSGAADILQPDVTVAGGITEWRKIAHMAACRDIAITPHWVPDIHVHLGAATPNVLALEYFDPGVGVLNFDRLLADPLRVENGEVIVPSRPGHGIELDLDAVKQYEVAV